MALPTNYIDTTGLTYCGTEAQEIFSKDIYALDLRSYGITMLDNVKSKRKIYMGDMDNAFQSYSCAFSPDGEVKLSEDYIEPVAIKVNKEFCREEFFDSYLVEQTSMSLNGGIPVSFSEWYFVRLREQMAKEYQMLFWKGDTDYTGSTNSFLSVVDGVAKKLLENDNVNKIQSTTFTVNNILSQVEGVVMSGMEVANTQEVDASDWKVFMNKADVMLLKMALGKLCCGNSTTDRFSNYAKEGEKIYIFGFEVVPTEQTRSQIIFGPAKNLVLGFDSFDSHLQYKVLYMMETTLDDAYRVAAITNIAVGIAWPELFTIADTTVQ